MEELNSMKEKTDHIIRAKLESGETGEIPVIIQTVDGLKKEDRTTVEALGGKVKDDLYIINAFSADIPLTSVKLLVLNQRVKKIFYDQEVRAM